jgi:serine/threonine protein kinase
MGSVPLFPFPGRSLGRYVMYDEIAAGGMATVHLGRLRGERGFARTVAIKRLHAQYARDPDFVSMLVDEARIAARVKHPNVVPPLDVIAIDEEELLLVMEYVHGEALARLLGMCVRNEEPVPPEIVVAIIGGALAGLHAAHEAVSDRGEPLEIVHRDVSPPNILVGTDGVSRVLDFGVAKAGMRASITRDGATKGKISYMSPEQLRGGPVDRRTDVFAMGIVLWETLTLRRLFVGDSPGQLSQKIVREPIPAASSVAPGAHPGFEAVLARALARPLEERFASALEFATALEAVVPPASPRQVGQWVARVAGERLAKRARVLARVESTPDDEPSGDSVPSLLTSGPQSGPQPVVVTRASVPLGRRRTVTAVSGVSALGLLVWGVATFAWGPRHPPRPAARLAIPVPAVAPAPTPVITPLPVLAPAPEVVTAPPATPVAAAAPATRVRRYRAKVVARRDCDPPYAIDARGIRRVKPGCLAP